MKRVLFIKRYCERKVRPANIVNHEAEPHINREAFDFSKLDFPNGKNYKDESPKLTEFLTW